MISLSVNDFYIYLLKKNHYSFLRKNHFCGSYMRKKNTSEDVPTYNILHNPIGPISPAQVFLVPVLANANLLFLETSHSC